MILFLFRLNAICYISQQDKNKKKEVFDRTGNQVVTSRRQIVLTRSKFIISRCWLVVCFELNGPLGQYFSLYRAGREKREVKDGRKKMPKQPHPHLLQVQWAFAQL